MRISQAAPVMVVFARLSEKTEVISHPPAIGHDEIVINSGLGNNGVLLVSETVDVIKVAVIPKDGAGARGLQSVFLDLERPLSGRCRLKGTRLRRGGKLRRPRQTRARPPSLRACAAVPHACSTGTREPLRAKRERRIRRLSDDA